MDSRKCQLWSSDHENILPPLACHSDRSPGGAKKHSTAVRTLVNAEIRLYPRPTILVFVGKHLPPDRSPRL